MALFTIGVIVGYLAEIAETIAAGIGFGEASIIAWGPSLGDIDAATAELFEIAGQSVSKRTLITGGDQLREGLYGISDFAKANKTGLDVASKGIHTYNDYLNNQKTSAPEEDVETKKK